MLWIILRNHDCAEILQKDCKFKLQLFLWPSGQSNKPFCGFSTSKSVKSIG
jgi:hypothetical protein